MNKARKMDQAGERDEARRELPGSLEPDLAPERGTTPVPVALIDKVMPTLRDTELRVLLVVVRQTLGWQVGSDPYLRKERDWLSQSQLMRRTGRASGAVAHAVDALVRRGLIDVLDGKEQLLTTPAERRRCLGKLYYRLHKIEGGPHQRRVTKSEYAKPHTTKDTLYKNKEIKKRIVDNSVENPRLIRETQWLQASQIASQRLSPPQSSKKNV